MEQQSSRNDIKLNQPNYLKIEDPDYSGPVFVNWQYIKEIAVFNPKEMFIKMKSGSVYRHVWKYTFK